MTLHELRELAARLPPGAALTLPRDVLLELCSEGAAVGTLKTEAYSGDLTVEQLADTLGRRPSTVRGWLEAGLFPGAYHLPASGKLSQRTGRPRVGAWRVPPAALEAFRAVQGPGGHGKAPRSVALADWRAVRAPRGRAAG